MWAEDGLGECGQPRSAEGSQEPPKPLSGHIPGQLRGHGELIIRTHGMASAALCGATVLGPIGAYLAEPRPGSQAVRRAG